MVPETLQDSFTVVSCFSHSYFLWDFCLFVYPSGCADSQESNGSALLPGQAASACSQHSWSGGQKWEGFCRLIRQSLGGESWC